MTDTPRLDRLDAMQRQPLGTFSPLRRPSPVATQYKRQAEMYGQALRTLSRAARRGDAGAAMDAIKVRDQANQSGFSPGGIQRSEDFQTNVAAREQSLMRQNADMGTANTLDRRNAATALGRADAVNPNATVGAGRGTAIKRAAGTGRTATDPKAASNGKEWVDVSKKAPMPAPELTRGPTMEMRNWSGLQDGRVGDRRPGDMLDDLTAPPVQRRRNWWDSNR